MSAPEYVTQHASDGRIEGTARALQTVTAADLQLMDFPPPTFVVPGFVVEGLTLLAGKPKVGKSWLAMDWCLAVACGGIACGSIECDPGDVLYAALEDSDRRLQRRIRQLLPGATTWPDRLQLTCEMRGFDDGGVGDLVDWCDGVANPRLIVIDTLARVRGKRPSHESQYQNDYGTLIELHGLANERDVAVLIVHHVRKMDSEDPLDTVSGTTGLTGAADSVLVLNRDSQGPVLYGRGRDLEEVETAMQFDKTTGQWTVLGGADEVRRSDARNRIIKELVANGRGMGPKEIAAATGLPETGVRKMLPRMVQAGELEKKGRGRYAAL